MKGNAMGCGGKPKEETPAEFNTRLAKERADGARREKIKHDKWDREEWKKVPGRLKLARDK